MPLYLLHFTLPATALRLPEPPCNVQSWRGRLSQQETESSSLSPPARSPRVSCATRGAAMSAAKKPIPPRPAVPSPTSTSSTHHSTSFLTSVSPLNLALVILNVEHLRTDVPQFGAAARFTHLWRQSSLRLCADGAANRLHDSLDETARARMLPDLITGDLDSLRGDVATFYSELGVPIEAEADQDTHDFEKCLRWLERRQLADAAGAGSGGAAASRPFSVVAVGAFGGRLDQQMANLNMAYAFSAFERFYLMSDSSIAFVLPPGKHVIEANAEAEDGSCGLIPLGGRCDRVVTTGCAHARES